MRVEVVWIWPEMCFWVATYLFWFIHGRAVFSLVRHAGERMGDKWRKEWLFCISVGSAALCLASVLWYVPNPTGSIAHAEATCPHSRPLAAQRLRERLNSCFLIVAGFFPRRLRAPLTLTPSPAALGVRYDDHLLDYPHFSAYDEPTMSAFEWDKYTFGRLLDLCMYTFQALVVIFVCSQVPFHLKTMGGNALGMYVCQFGLVSVLWNSGIWTNGGGYFLTLQNIQSDEYLGDG